MKTGENGVSGGCQTSHSLGSHPLVPPPAAIGPSPDPLTGVQDSQGSGEFLSCQQPIGKVIKPGWSCVGTAGQHDGGAVGKVAGPGAVTEALQCEAKADKARADGEAELEQEAEQEVMLGLLRNGLKIFPCCHRHDGAMRGLPQQRDAEQKVAKAGQPQDVSGTQEWWQLD